MDGTRRSRHTVEAAARLARDTRADLTVTCAYGEVSAQDRALIARWLGRDAYSVSPAAAADELVHAAAACARGQGVGRIVERSMRGAPEETLLMIAADTRADLIVVGDRDFSSRWDRIFRSFSTEIARRSRTDVLIINSADR
ncbi:universal stress protein [Nocardia sp. NPDC051052]|uniref:universal stress protein n=1 Tax=Nocardia sp. NPDC051052 TaxID=3364322 RepID=UPI003795DA9A